MEYAFETFKQALSLLSARLGIMGAPHFNRVVCGGTALMAANLIIRHFTKDVDVVALMDENGNLRIVGRIKDMIVRGGENISPTEIEGILYTYPKVAQVSVVAIPDERLGEKTCACIIPKPNEHITQEEVKAFFKDKVAHFKIPDRVELMTEFPTTPSGKIKKNVLREIMAEKIQKENERRA